MNIQDIVIKIKDYFMVAGEYAKADLCNIILAQLDNEAERLALTKDECLDLLAFFDSLGWIDREQVKVHDIIGKIEEFVNGRRKFSPLKKADVLDN
jgi:hypothetical protein